LFFFSHVPNSLLGREIRLKRLVRRVGAPTLAGRVEPFALRWAGLCPLRSGVQSASARRRLSQTEKANGPQVACLPVLLDQRLEQVFRHSIAAKHLLDNARSLPAFNRRPYITFLP
jgi:hypothetical protein